jgi:hypothetical protein
MLRRMDSLTSALRNLESRLALALDSAQQAEHDLNSVRLRAGLPPHKWFHLSAAVAPAPQVGPKAAVRLSAEDSTATSEMLVEAGMVRRGEAVDMAAARKLRLVERGRNR